MYGQKRHQNKSMEQSPVWEANNSSVAKKFSALYESRKSITMFTRAR